MSHEAGRWSQPNVPRREVHRPHASQPGQEWPSSGAVWGLAGAALWLGTGGSLVGGEQGFGISGMVVGVGQSPRWVSTHLTAYGGQREHTGPFGELSVARYHVALSSGRIGTCVRGYKPPADFVIPESAGGQGVVDCWDTLRFTVPAGHYPSGLVATLRGRLTGNLAAVGRVGINYSSASQYARVVFQGAGSPPGSDYRWAYSVTVLPEQSPRTISTISAPFAVSTWLALPGDNYILPRTRQVSFSARLEAAASAVAWNAPGQEAEGVSDFGGSVQLLVVETPPGVTWTSDSGVFLTGRPGAVPRLTVRLVAPHLLELTWSTNWADGTLEWTPNCPHRSGHR